MKKWTKESLEAAGYTIENAYIKSADLNMEDHGCITLYMSMDLECGSVIYGGMCLGKGYLGAKTFQSNGSGMIYLMRIMDVLGVSRFSNLKDAYCRVATKGLGSCVKIIGNILKDEWFDPESFFEEYKKENKINENN